MRKGHKTGAKEAPAELDVIRLPPPYPSVILRLKGRKRLPRRLPNSSRLTHLHEDPAISPLARSEDRCGWPHVQRNWTPRRYCVKFGSLIVRVAIIPP